MQAARQELEEREKVRGELRGAQVWLKAADSLLLEMERSSSTQELQVGLKLLFVRVTSHLRVVFCSMI